MKRTRSLPINHLLAAMLVLILWMLITMGGEILQAGSDISLTDLVSQQVILALIIAPLFLLAIARFWYRWHNLGLNQPASLKTLTVTWLPVLYIVLMLSIANIQGFPESRVITIVLCNAMLVGISEELMFRGILFNAARSQFSIWQAIWFTSIVFGGIHAFNSFITGDLTAALMQSLLATSSGIWFIAIRLRTASLIPVMIIHGLWDFSVFMLAYGADPGESESLSAEFQIFIQVIFIVPLFLYGIYLLRNVSKNLDNK